MGISIVPSAAGSLPASSPSGKGVGPMRPWTLVIIGIALTAATVRAFLAPFPGIGGNAVLDLIAYHDPGLHTVIHVWYYAAPGIALLLAGSICLSVSRVWLEPPTRRGARGKLPAWLVVPEKGLYTGVLIVGAVGTGKTTACMYPFAQQLLSWRADEPGRRAGALVLEVKGDFCHQVRRILGDAGSFAVTYEVPQGRMRRDYRIRSAGHPRARDARTHPGHPREHHEGDPGHAA